MRRNSLILVSALLVSGCATRQPEAVYVDIDRVLAAQPSPALKAPALPVPPQGSPAYVVHQPELPASGNTRKTLERLNDARRLIAENRGKSVAAMTAMLNRIYKLEADAKIAIRERENQPKQDQMLDEVFAEIRTLFEAYGRERGPLIANLNVVSRTRKIELNPQPIPVNADAIRVHNIKLANELRAKIRKIDSDYDKRADALLAAAMTKITNAIDELAAQAAADRQKAIDSARAEAESQADKTRSALDVQLNQLVPETFPAIPPRTVTIAGSPPLPPPPADTSKAIFGSLAERRHLVDQQIEIWVASTGRTRSLEPRGVSDATEEFLKWRNAHKVGP